MRADRGVDAHGLAVALQHRVIQRIAHAVQALELEVTRGLGRIGQGQNAGHGMGVVAGELRVNHPTGVLAQQVAGAGQVRGVGAFLAGEHRVVVQALLLGVFDLGVPVGTLDQAQRHLRAQLLAQQGQPHQHRQAALGVGLHHQADLAPALQGRCAQEFLVQLQGQLQAVGFLGVDGNPHIQGAGTGGQLQHIGEQLGQHALALGHLITWVQRGELDRDRRPRPRTDLRLLAHGVDGQAVVGHVLLGVGLGQRGFAEHVEGIAVALLPLRPAIFQRLADVAAKHELLAHQLHGLVHRRANHRLAGALDQPADDILRRAIGVFRIDHLAGQHQAPGGKVDQHVVALAEVAFPLGGIQFVADQGVGRGGIRHPQQSLGQAHEHQPFLGIEAVLTKQCVEGIDGIVPATHVVNQRTGIAADSRDTIVTGVGELQELS